MLYQKFGYRPKGLVMLAGKPLDRREIVVDHVTSGEAGCNDPALARTAIAFDASGLDQVTPVRVYAYIFRNRDAFDRLRLVDEPVGAKPHRLDAAVVAAGAGVDDDRHVDSALPHAPRRRRRAAGCAAADCRSSAP